MVPTHDCQTCTDTCLRNCGSGPSIKTPPEAKGDWCLQQKSSKVYEVEFREIGVRQSPSTCLGQAIPRTPSGHGGVEYQDVPINDSCEIPPPSDCRLPPTSPPAPCVPHLMRLPGQGEVLKIPGAWQASQASSRNSGRTNHRTSPNRTVHATRRVPMWGVDVEWFPS